MSAESNSEKSVSYFPAVSVSVISALGLNGIALSALVDKNLQSTVSRQPRTRSYKPTNDHITNRHISVSAKLWYRPIPPLGTFLHDAALMWRLSVYLSNYTQSNVNNLLNTFVKFPTEYGILLLHLPYIYDMSW